MNYVQIVAIIILFGFTACAQQNKELTKDDIKTDVEKVSYSIAQDIGKNLSHQQIEISIPAFTQGLSDALAGKALFTDEEMKSILMDFQKSMMAKRDAKSKIDGEKNKSEGEKFFEENKKKEGVVTLPSGLQYKIIKKGNGPKPKASDRVKVHYKGTSLDGKEFDSSYKRNKPAVFGVGGVIKGWTEALQLMPVGSKWQLFIPYNLAYGENGKPPTIGPYQALVFEVELLGINPK